MTAGVLGVVAAYVVLAILLLSLNLRSGWRWRVKAWAISVTASFFVGMYLAVQAMLGWPTEIVPPATFQLHAAVIDEPDRRRRTSGAIYLWLSPRHRPGEPVEPPRAYALPYSRELHEAAARAQSRLQEGRTIDGKATSRPDGERYFGSRDVQLDLFERAPPPLPSKS